MSYAKKINALLAKAASSTHDAEREAFTEAAERLMIKWGIDDAMLEDAAAGTTKRRSEKVERRVYVEEGSSSDLLAKWVAARAAGGLGSIKIVLGGGSRWYAVGYPSDLARVDLYVPQIVDQARQAWKRYLRLEGAYSYSKARRAFFIGFGMEVRKRLQDMFRDEVAATGTELVLVRRESDVDEALKGYFPDLTKGRRVTVRDHAYGAGKRAGREANLNAGALVGV